MVADEDTLIDGPLFSGLDRELVSAALHLGRPRSFAFLQKLMAQGEIAASMYVILRGRVRVVRHTDDGRSIALAELGPGEGVGEMGLIDARPRGATVVAIEPTETIEIDAEVFTTLSRRFPQFYAHLARVLSERLRSTTHQLLEHGGGVAAPADPTDPGSAPMPTSGQGREENRALIARCRELVVRQDWAGLEGIVSPEFSWFGLSGARGMREGWRRITDQLGDVRTTIRQVIADGDWVVEVTTVEGAASSPVVYLYRVENAKIAEIIRVADDVRQAATA